MNKLGGLICFAGTAVAVIYPPYNLVGQTGWGFVWGNIVQAFGHAIPIREHLDMQLLLLEILVINVVGVALMLAGRR